MTLDRVSTRPEQSGRIAILRSLAYHREVARRLEGEPAILDRARAAVERWLAAGGRSLPYALRWQELLARPIDVIVRVLVDESEDSNDLRQATPFAGVLDARERWRLWRRVRERVDSTR